MSKMDAVLCGMFAVLAALIIGTMIGEKHCPHSDWPEMDRKFYISESSRVNIPGPFLAPDGLEVIVP